MILVRGVLGGGFLGISDSLDQPVFIERQARNRPDDGAQIAGALDPAQTARQFSPHTPGSIGPVARQELVRTFAPSSSSLRLR